MKKISGQIGPSNPAIEIIGKTAIALLVEI
jgi:hypothetical protein